MFLKYNTRLLINFVSGTMGLEKVAAVVEKEQGSLYCLDTDGTIKKHLDKISISNGLAWSADDKTMYYIDSIPRCVYSFDYDIENGSICKFASYSSRRV